MNLEEIFICSDESISWEIRCELLCTLNAQGPAPKNSRALAVAECSPEVCG